MRPMVLYVGRSLSMGVALCTISAGHRRPMFHVHVLCELRRGAATVFERVEVARNSFSPHLVPFPGGWSFCGVQPSLLPLFGSGSWSAPCVARDHISIVWGGLIRLPHCPAGHGPKALVATLSCELPQGQISALRGFGPPIVGQPMWAHPARRVKPHIF